MSEKKNPEGGDGDITTQPSISADEAAETEVEGSPVGDTPVDLPVGDEPSGTPRTVDVESIVQVRDAAKREIDVRLMPWDVVINTILGPETFARGAFADTKPEKVFLMEPEHEIRLGVGQDGRPRAHRRAIGKGVSLDDRPDGAYMTFKVAATQTGDEVLALAADGITGGVSPEFMELPGGTAVEVRNGRRTRVHRRVRLTGASTTYQPAYGDQAAVLAVRSHQEGAAHMGEAQEAAPVAAAEAAAPSQITNVVNLDPVMAAITKQFGQFESTFADRLERIEARARENIDIPKKDEGPYPDDFGRGNWMQLILKVMSGDTVSQAELQARTAADLITTDNLGVVPPAYLSEIIGVIDPSRPFLNSTRRLNTPQAGMQITVPVLATKPTVGVQAEEKDELASTTTSITSTNFNPITIGGYGDISLQLLKRSDPSYLELYVDLLAEAYAIMADDKAVDSLLAASGIHTGTAIDPNDGAQFGDAWAFATAVSRRLVPDTVWLSSPAVAAFIDAKSSTTNAPLYANLAANFTAGGGVGGTISGLRPVHVPALDDEAVDIIVGPSRGFAWAEDGTYTLQVDVPARAGRDVGLVGMLWNMPLYPAAFTKYNLAS